MTRRLEFTAATKREALERSGGACECHRVPQLAVKCGGLALGAGNTFFEHIICDAIGPDNSLDNCAVLTKTCWRAKTAGYDLPVIAKTKRQADRNSGIRPAASRPLPGSRRDPFKFPLAGGGPVDRRTGQPWRGW